MSMRHVAPGFLAARRVDQLGTEMVFAVAEEAAALAAQGRDVYPFHMGELDFPTPPNIVEACARALRDGKTKYTPNGGVAELRDALAFDVGRDRGVTYGAGERRHTAGRQAGDRQVPAGPHGPGRRGPVSEPGLPDLLVPHRVLRRRGGAVRLLGGARRLPHRPGRPRGAHHLAHAPPDHQRPPQSDRRRRAPRRRWSASRSWCWSTTSSSSATRRTSPSATAAAASRWRRGRRCRSAR